MENKEKSTEQYSTRREKFLSLLKSRVEKQLDLHVSDTYFTYKVAVEPNKIYLVPSIEDDGIRLVFSTATFRKVVYNNVQGNLEEIIQSYDMVAATQMYDGDSERISFGKTMAVTSETTSESVIKFWLNN